MSQSERPPGGVLSEDGLSAWEPGPDIELGLSIPPGDAVARVTAAVESGRLALHSFDRRSTRRSGVRTAGEEFVFHVVQGHSSLNALSMVCEGKVAPRSKGSCVEIRLHVPSLARLFLIAWTAFVLLVGIYEVMDAWPDPPSWRMLGVTSVVSVLVVAAFIFAKRYGRQQELRMRRLLKELFADVTVYVRERPVPG